MVGPLMTREGDGVVFKGANGPWMTGKKEFHLTGGAAKVLISTVLETCRPWPAWRAG